MTYAIKDAARTVEVTEAESIVVTTVVEDTANGGFVRDVRVMATPLGETVAQAVLTLRIRAATADVLHIDVPASEM